jgi:hypothetical protein
MKRLLASVLAVAVAGPVAFAQPLTEPRLAGGPERICSADEIRQALAGSYTGSPCRFTEMPAGLDAAPRRPVPQQAAAGPALVPAGSATHSISPQPAYHSPPLLARPEQVRPVSYRENIPAAQPVVVSQSRRGNAFIDSQQGLSVRSHGAERAQTVGRQWPPQQAAPAAARPSHRAETRHGEVEDRHGDTIRLSDEFFSGSLVGGVERPYAPVYSYRGMILIAADGQVRTGHTGPGQRVRQVQALDHRTVPVSRVGHRRAHP